MAAPSKWKSTVGLAKGTCLAHGQLLWNLQMHFFLLSSLLITFQSGGSQVLEKDIAGL